MKATNARQLRSSQVQPPAQGNIFGESALNGGQVVGEAHLFNEQVLGLAIGGQAVGQAVLEAELAALGRQ